MRDSRETITPRAFVAGYPIKHSRSPIIHGYWLERLGIQGSYEKVAVTPEDFPAFIRNLKNGDAEYVGGNITIPHKEAACRLADRVDPLAEELGAANTLWLAEGRLLATNTDGIGFASNLDAGYPGWDKAEVAVVLGAGGASRAILQSLRDRALGTIHVVNRTVARAQELVDRFGPRLQAHAMAALPELLQDATLFVNTSSLGMDGGEAPQLPFETMRPGSLVTDIVYVPLKTPFLSQAEAAGLPTVDGLGMLLHQAVPGFEKWFGQMPEVTEELRRLVLADIEAGS
ncbi:shikimate dehydrogenase [Rhizobium sp. Root274]|uniref:shikimate dehydrogenase n=1 Tax=unclassified Rhizobium TaxID=2613769 RepID=UPI0007158164|nr:MULTISPECIES: shikimate dehydrogenase [unclassified Rhizobium]KQW27826.1 shikimate dehydrogenase [Rhizobium sp. Root1240]KRD28107.1 shikimate dehydrogenase [Rhizobium sp. Root274]